MPQSFSASANDPILSTGGVPTGGTLGVPRIGTLGTARITPKALLTPASSTSAVRVVAVAARDLKRAQRFARKHGIERVHADYLSLIEDPEIDAVYNPLPVSLHKPWTIAAIRAGKHVLCEKPFTLNATEAEQVASAAEEASVVVCEAFHTRYHPVMLRALEIVNSGTLGAIQSADAHFDAPIEDTPTQIRYRYELGGGATMDLGCYPLHWLRHLLGGEPQVTQARAVVGPTHVDVALQATLDFDGVCATVSCDMRPTCTYSNGFELRGTRATLTVRNPLSPQMGHSLNVVRSDGAAAPDLHEELTHRMTFDFQLEAFAQAIRDRGADRSAALPTDAQDGVRSMRVLDAVYLAAGLPVRGN